MKQMVSLAALDTDTPHVSWGWEIQLWQMQTTGTGHKLTTLIASFMGPPWGPPEADRTQVGPKLALWTLLSGIWHKICKINFLVKFWEWNHQCFWGFIWSIYMYSPCLLYWYWNSSNGWFGVREVTLRLKVGMAVTKIQENLKCTNPVHSLWDILMA